MNIVWFTWKDIKHPQAGGAEAISWQLMRDLVKHGHDVKVVTAAYPGSTPHQTIDGIEVYRTGGRYTVYHRAHFLYKRLLASWAELLVDEMNTVPFGCAFYSRTPSVLLTYQLARQVWFYQAWFPFSLIGYLLEPLYLFALSRQYQTVATESESTRQDLNHFGFPLRRIGVFRVGIELQPLKSLPPQTDPQNILVLGATRPMKRTLSAVKGFEYARDKNPGLRLTIAGDNHGAYADKLSKHVADSRHRTAITVLGRVDAKTRLKLMKDATMIVVASIKEGWGLIVTEANSQGTPAIAYDCDGLRDSVSDGETGLLVKSGDEKALGHAINKLSGDSKLYQKLRLQAWHSSKQYSYENCYQDFVRIAGIEPTATEH